MDFSSFLPYVRSCWWRKAWYSEIRTSWLHTTWLVLIWPVRLSSPPPSLRSLNSFPSSNGCHDICGELSEKDSREEFHAWGFLNGLEHEVLQLVKFVSANDQWVIQSLQPSLRTDSHFDRRCWCSANPHISIQHVVFLIHATQPLLDMTSLSMTMIVLNKLSRSVFDCWLFSTVIDHC